MKKGFVFSKPFRKFVLIIRNTKTIRYVVEQINRSNTK
jgi:hypothetical protein